MPRVRQNPRNVTGSIRLTAGSLQTLTKKTARTRALGAISTGASPTGTVMAGTKSISSGSTMHTGLDNAQILISGTYINEVKNHMNQYGGIGAMRHMKLYTTGGLNVGMTSWTNSTSVLKSWVDMYALGNATQKAALGRLWPTLCYRSYTDANFDAAMDAIPAWMENVTYIYQQEADRNTSNIQDYLNVHAAMNARRAIHPNGSKVWFCKNMTHGGTVRTNNGAGLQSVDYAGIGWKWTGQTTTSTTGQRFDRMTFGWDIYDEKQTTNQCGYFPTGAEMFGTPNAYNANIPSMEEQIGLIGLPWCAPEWGMTQPEVPDNGPYYLETQNLPKRYTGNLRVANGNISNPGTGGTPAEIAAWNAATQYKGDYNLGTRRTAAMSSWLDWFEAHGCMWNNYWCANGTAGTPIKFYHLDVGSNPSAPLWIPNPPAPYTPSISLLKSKMADLVAHP